MKTPFILLLSVALLVAGSLPGRVDALPRLARGSAGTLRPRPGVGRLVARSRWEIGASVACIRRGVGGSIGRFPPADIGHFARFREGIGERAACSRMEGSGHDPRPPERCGWSFSWGLHGSPRVGRAGPRRVPACVAGVREARLGPRRAEASQQDRPRLVRRVAHDDPLDALDTLILMGLTQVPLPSLRGRRHGGPRPRRLQHRGPPPAPHLVKAERNQEGCDGGRLQTLRPLAAIRRPSLVPLIAGRPRRTYPGRGPREAKPGRGMFRLRLAVATAAMNMRTLPIRRPRRSGCRRGPARSDLHRDGARLRAGPSLSRRAWRPWTGGDDRQDRLHWDW